MFKKKLIDFCKASEAPMVDWDWETAFVDSIAKSRDVTRNRMSNNLLKAALNDPTPAAYNPFSAGSKLKY